MRSLVTTGPAAYSCLALLRDGTSGLFYETGRDLPYEKITLARFNVLRRRRVVVAQRVPSRPSDYVVL